MQIEFVFQCKIGAGESSGGEGKELEESDKISWERGVPVPCSSYLKIAAVS